MTPRSSWHHHPITAPIDPETGEKPSVWGGAGGLVLSGGGCPCAHSGSWRTVVYMTSVTPLSTFLSLPPSNYTLGNLVQIHVISLILLASGCCCCRLDPAQGDPVGSSRSMQEEIILPFRVVRPWTSPDLMIWEVLSENLEYKLRELSVETVRGKCDLGAKKSSGVSVEGSSSIKLWCISSAIVDSSWLHPLSCFSHSCDRGRISLCKFGSSPCYTFMSGLLFCNTFCFVFLFHIHRCVLFTSISPGEKQNVF